MKNASRTQGRILSLVFVAAVVLFTGFVHSVSAQNLCGYGRSVGPCQSKEPSFPGSLGNDNGFNLGRRLAVCLMNDCTVFVGVIESIDINEDKRFARTRFRISERLGADAESGPGEGELYIGWSPKGDDTFFDVRLAPGSLLMIGKRPNSEPIDFAVGNEKYFSSVRSAVIFNNSSDLREGFASVLGPLRDQSDNVLAGYVSEKCWRLATVGNMEEHLTVLQKLFADPNFPSHGLWSIGEGLSLILRRESERPSAASRDEVIRKLLELSSSADKDKAITAIRVLTTISEKDWFQPKRYLDWSEAQKLIQIVHKIKGMETDPLEEKLSQIN